MNKYLKQNISQEKERGSLIMFSFCENHMDFPFKNWFLGSLRSKAQVCCLSSKILNILYDRHGFMSPYEIYVMPELQVASCWNTLKKPPCLRQPASAEFDNENSPPNQMVAAVHGLLIVNRDQTRLN